MARRIELERRLIKGWELRARIFEDDFGNRIGYSYQFQRKTTSGFIEYVRFDLHRNGASESAPHVHIRLEGEEPSDYKEFIRRFMEILALVPKIQRVIK